MNRISLALSNMLKQSTTNNLSIRSYQKLNQSWSASNEPMSIRFNSYMMNQKKQTSLIFTNKRFFFSKIFQQPLSLEQEIQQLEESIAQLDKIKDTSVIQKIDKLIEMKTTLNSSSTYIGYVQDIQKKANALYSMKKSPEAIYLLKECEKGIQKALLSQISDPKEKRNLFVELADSILMRVQMLDANSTKSQNIVAIEEITKSIKFLEEVGESYSEQMVVALQSMGEIFYKLGEINKSAEFIEKSAYLLEDLINKNPSKEDNKNLLLRQAICFETLGNLHFDMRSMAQAESFFTSSLTLWEYDLQENNNQTQLLKKKPQTLDLLISDISFQNRDPKAILHPLHIRCINSIGAFYSTSGQISKALSVLQSIKQHITDQEKNADNYSWLLLSMAKSYYKQQNYQISYQLCLESENAARKFEISSINLAQILEHKSCLLTMQAKHKESAAAIQEALSLFNESSSEPIYCRLLFSRGMQCIQSEEFEKAIIYANKSKYIVENSRGSEDEQVGDALRVIGMAECCISFRSQGIKANQMCEDGINNLEKALKIFSQDNNTRIQDQEAILGDLSKIYEYKGNLKKAIISYEQMRQVRIHILEKVGISANSDQIINQIDQKISFLYTSFHPQPKNN